MQRETWTDERLDDAIYGLRDETRELRTEIRALRTETREEFRAMRAEMHEGFGALGADITSLRKDLLRSVLAMNAALAATIVTIALKSF